MVVRHAVLSAIAAAALSSWVAADADIAPQFQVLVPGFEVCELPIQLPNLNNVRYRSDGSLYALGYNGNVWLLKDTNADGLEDLSQVFFKNTNQLRGPIGMAVIPDGHVLLFQDGKASPKARGVVVASKGKVSALVDYDGDDVAEVERVIASGWQEIPPNVDTIGIAIHPIDGSIYFGLGTAEFDNPYLIGAEGRSAWKITSDRGTVQRIKPDLTARETVCTGVRFTIGLQFNEHGDLFATDQEGATWLSNGNPFDELLHIRTGRHYGFPPRHPQHLPQVFDEPSLFDYRPQHQSACGLTFNVARSPISKTFGSKYWNGDAFVAGQSRGKIFRTKLVRTGSGDYLAVNQVFACLSMLVVDCTITPGGGLLVCCHSGEPDWGTGPSGEGKLFLVRNQSTDLPLPIAAWSSGPHECRIVFDQALNGADLQGIAGKISITAGPFVAAGDRFEVIRPGYEVVQSQQVASTRDIAVYSASVTPDQRTLVLSTALQVEAMQYAVRLPGMGGRSERPLPGTLPQINEIDLDYSLAGVLAEWRPSSSQRDAVSEMTVDPIILPHVDFDVVRAIRRDEPETDKFVNRIVGVGKLKLTTRITTNGLFLPATQPGSALDFKMSDDRWITRRELRLRSSHPMTVQFRGDKHEGVICGKEHCVDLDVGALESELPLLEVTIATDTRPVSMHADWLVRFQDGSERSGPIPMQRLLVPWAILGTPSTELAKRRDIPQLVGANWGRGRQIFRGQEALCSRCHIAHGEGGRIGPDLSNLVHRDYDSVVRDIRHPSYSINPDFISYTVVAKSGEVLTGVLQNDGLELKIGDSQGNTTTLAQDDVEKIQASTVSVMPEGLSAKLSDQQFRDLVAYLLLPPPTMPRDLTEPGAPIRKFREVRALLDGAVETETSPKPLNLLLLAGPQDHGPGEHDYPAWLRVWGQLLAAAENVSVDTAMNWPSEDQLRMADTIVIYQKGTWDDERARAVDAHLAKGGGLVLIHWAVEGEGEAAAFAARIGLASDLKLTQYRHGALSVDWHVGRDHPIARNLTSISLEDESYWNLVEGGEAKILATGGVEEGGARPPLFWTVQPSRGRVFVSIPGHYSWTFDDPVFRTILLRGIAWASEESVDRFNDLVTIGATFTDQSK